MKVEETDPLDSACPLNTFLLPFKGGVEKEIRAISPLSWPFFPSFPRIRGEKHVSSVASFGQNAVEILGRRPKCKFRGTTRRERLSLYPDRAQERV